MTISIPRIGSPFPSQGGIYAGIVRGENDQPDYHLIHATAEHEIVDVDWKTALKKTVASIDGFTDWSLPNRREARLLAINSPDDFDKDDLYWTSEQSAINASYAWFQDFSVGLQDGSRKSLEYRARAVRRILIMPTNDLINSQSCDRHDEYPK
jgi:hypothetical protein